MRLRSQFFVQLVGNIINTALFVAMAPFLVSSIGLERYGVLLLVLGFTIYIGIAELGLGAATSREVAAAEPSSRSQILGTSLCLSIGMGVIGGALFALLAWPPIGRLLVGKAQIVAELNEAGPSLFILGVSTVVSGIPQGALLGLSRFLTMNCVTLIGTFLATIAPAAYAGLVGSDLSGLIASIASAKLAVSLLALLCCLQAGMWPQLVSDRALANRLLSYGGWTTVSTFAHRVTNSIDRVLISAIAGVSSVPIFVLPQGALSRTQMFAGALMSAAFPRLARGPNDVDLIEQCYRALFVLAPAYVLGIGLIRSVLIMWIGPEFAAASYRVAAMLGVWAWFELIGYVPYVLLQARAQLDREAMIGTIIIVPNLVSLIVCILVLGPFGAALIGTLRSITYLVLRLRVCGTDGVPLGELLAYSAAVVIACMAVLMAPAGYGNIVLLVVAFAACCTLILNFIRPAGFARELLDAIAVRLRRMLRKLLSW